MKISAGDTSWLAVGLAVIVAAASCTRASSSSGSGTATSSTASSSYNSAGAAGGGSSNSAGSSGSSEAADEVQQHQQHGSVGGGFLGGGRVFAATSGGGGGGGGGSTTSVESFAGDEPPPPQLPPFNPLAPYFDSNTPTNMTAQLGKTAYLSCMVRQLGNKTVSWVRHRDLHILTVGRYTYISDQRFQAYHLANTDDWTLQIRYTQLRDAGIYECQVSTEPKMSLLINLNVVVPQAQIPGAPDIYVKTGSTITLQCVITLCPEPPVYIFWYHEDKVINYATTRRTFKVETLREDTTVSRLLITNAQPSDSGNYSCSPADADVTSVNVHVLNGEKPAAMQHGKHSSSERLQSSAVLLLVLLWRIGLL